MPRRATAEMAAVIARPRRRAGSFRVALGATEERPCPPGARADDAGDARSDVPPTQPLYQQAQPSPSRSVCCPACPLSRELPPGSQPRGNGFGLFSLTGTQDEARAYAARRREGGPREELSTDDLHRSAGERVRRARYCGVGTPADCGRRAVPHKNWTKTACRSPGSGAPRSAFGSSGRAGYSPANRWC